MSDPTKGSSPGMEEASLDTGCYLRASGLQCPRKRPGWGEPGTPGRDEGGVLEQRVEPGGGAEGRESGAGPVARGQGRSPRAGPPHRAARLLQGVRVTAPNLGEAAAGSGADAGSSHPLGGA